MFRSIIRGRPRREVKVEVNKLDELQGLCGNKIVGGELFFIITGWTVSPLAPKPLIIAHASRSAGKYKHVTLRVTELLYRKPPSTYCLCGLL